MVIQGLNQADYEWLTPSRLRVLRELTDDIPEREIANRLKMTYAGVRSIVEELKNKTGLRSVRDVRRWWRENRGLWAEWVLAQGGVNKEGYLG